MQEINKLCMGCMSSLNGDAVCSVCGFDSSKYSEPNALPLRTMLAGRYLVGKVISKTGEGFTYLSFDTVTEAIVKITEYFPEGFCSRNDDFTVKINGDTSYVFNEGIMKFIELHKAIAGLSELSAIYRIIDIFEVNGTAYSVNEHLQGITLKEFLIRNGGVLTWEQVRPLYLPLINAINSLHEKGIIHGGISPETLIVGRDGRIRITDFLIPEVRKTGGNMTAQLYPGFAAIEQYRGEALTPSTDIYAIGATLFRTLTGNPPPDSKQRLENDNMTFSRSVAEKVPRSVLVAMANALQLEPANRTQKIEDLKANLQTASEPTESEDRPQKNSNNGKKSGNSNKKYVLIAALATALILAIIAGIFYILTLNNDNDDTASASSEFISSYESYHTVDASSTPEKHLSVPDFSGKSLAELLANNEYAEWFDFKVVKKEYNNKVSRGKICAQSVKIGTAAKKGTVVEFTVSLGPEKVTVPKALKGMNKDQALIEILKLGVDYNNITVIGKLGEETTEEFIVFETSPAMGTKINPDEAITIYYNTNVVLPASSEPEYPTNDYDNYYDGYYGN
ncbi:MAG: PASTA domain-containing protein [Ruminococcaceae bacterium]|nr:PASTA domain-containing protein [Oscillospiraceae bacterium]